MQLYKAVDAIDNEESFFLVYPSGDVAVMAVVEIDTVKAVSDHYFTSPASRFQDAVNPVLVEEW